MAERARQRAERDRCEQRSFASRVGAIHGWAWVLGILVFVVAGLLWNGDTGEVRPGLLVAAGGCAAMLVITWFFRQLDGR